jgi:hypothetical protein
MQTLWQDLRYGARMLLNHPCVYRKCHPARVEPKFIEPINSSYPVFMTTGRSIDVKPSIDILISSIRSNRSVDQT